MKKTMFIACLFYFRISVAQDFYIGGLHKGKDPKKSESHHTPDFFIDESGFKTGVNALCNFVFDYADLKNRKMR